MMNESLQKIANQLMSKKNRAMIVVLLASVLILALFGFFSEKPGEETRPPATAPADAQSYGESLERRLSEILSKTEGVGRAEVMITLKSGGEHVFAKEERDEQNITAQRPTGGESNTSQQSQSSQRSVVVVNDGSGGQKPVLLKELEPEIKGVVVVCDGGGDKAVELRVIEAVKTLLGLSSGRICVVPRA